MANFVLAQIDAAIDLFTSLIQHGAKSPRYTRNLQWLMKLRARLSSKIAAASAASRGNLQQETSNEQRDEDEDAELVGWRTRLVERIGQNQRVSRTIHLAPTPTGSQITDNLNMSPNRTSMMPNPSVPPTSLTTTDDLVSLEQLPRGLGLICCSSITFGIQCCCKISLRYREMILM